MEFGLRMSSMDLLVGGAVVGNLYGRAESDKAAQKGRAKFQVTWTLALDQEWTEKSEVSGVTGSPVCLNDASAAT